MDVLKDVEVIKEDIDDVNNKCSKIQCNPIYETFKAIIKLFTDMFKCIKRKMS